MAQRKLFAAGDSTTAAAAFAAATSLDPLISIVFEDFSKVAILQLQRFLTLRVEDSDKFELAHFPNFDSVKKKQFPISISAPPPCCFQAIEVLCSVARHDPQPIVDLFRTWGPDVDIPEVFRFVFAVIDPFKRP